MDGGSHFAGIPSPPARAGDVTQLRFASALDGYAFEPQLWQTTDGGSSWAKVATAGEVTDVEAADGEAYALACESGSCQSMELLRSPVGSGAWQKVATPVTLGYGAQFALSGPNLYLLSGNAPPLVLLYSADKATTFTKRVDPGTPSLGGRVTAAADGSATLWAVSPTGMMAATELSTDGGTTWHVVTPTGGFPNSQEITAASSSVALAWPGPEVSGEAPAALARTTDGGTRFSAVLSSSGRVSWAGFSDPFRAYALVSSRSTPTTQLFESTDGGATWQNVVIKS